ncbi:hypothetical protein FQN60_005483 [Etheostoma spectabile]|uniref:BHLH domain-containing protein n=1 Tax=Etheostoma spectabile TaxID=54343 RepID=A0A5J5CEI5_9PERO|nr:hypothetical protein FQN60_005483 [Etheostoma spectabile]
MSANGSDGTADRPADLAAEGECPKQAGSLPPAVESLRKRKGDVEERSGTHGQQSVDFQMDDDLSRSEGEDQQVKMKCFREPHRQIEKRRRDKMNTLIDELAAMIPASGTGSAFTDTTSKPSILSQDDLKHLLLRAVDGFLLVVSCDRAKILFISESVSKILNLNRVAGVQVQVDAPARLPLLSTGARRSFFCRLKHSRVAGKQEDKHFLPCTSKKKDTSRYCTLHCTGYMRSCPSSQLDSEGDGEMEGSDRSCLVTVCRLLSPVSHQPPKELSIRPSEFVTRWAIDGKATTVIGYLPQEVLGTSCYEYFHQDDLLHLADKHRQVLRSKEKIETHCYKFKTKYGSYVSLQSQWFSFTNPWTKEVEFIVSSNQVVLGSGHTKDEEAGNSKALQEDTKQIPIIPGLSSGVGTMIYAGSIGTQIANELMDSYSKMNSSPSSGACSPFGLAQEKCPRVSPLTSTSASSREEASGSSSQSQCDSRTAEGASSAASESSAAVSRIALNPIQGEPSQLDLDLVPGLSSFSSDEAAMAVIMSLLETDVNMGESGDFEGLHWPF